MRRAVIQASPSPSSILIARTKSDNGRPFASTDPAFHVANRLSDPLGELLLRENSSTGFAPATQPLGMST